MTPLLDARPVAKAVLAVVSIAIATSEDPTQLAYDRSQVPGTGRNDGDLPTLFAQVDVERRFDESANRDDGTSGSTSWRVIVGGVGLTWREASWVLAEATAALEDVWHTTDDGHQFNCRFETYRAPDDQDDGRYYGAVTFTCAT